MFVFQVSRTDWPRKRPNSRISSTGSSDRHVRGTRSLLTEPRRTGHTTSFYVSNFLTLAQIPGGLGPGEQRRAMCISLTSFVFLVHTSLFWGAKEGNSCNSVSLRGRGWLPPGSFIVNPGWRFIHLSKQDTNQLPCSYILLISCDQTMLSLIGREVVWRWAKPPYLLRLQWTRRRP